VATAFLEQANGGFYGGGGRDARVPVSTITATGSQQQLVTADLAQLSPEHQEGALRVAAFLVKYYGSGIAVDPRDPLDTVTTKDRLALVTVVIKGTPYVIVDIGLRMLKPHELYRAQGFPAGYIIDRTANGTPLTTSAAVRMVGNSVSPPPLRALATANLDPVAVPMAVAA
jgi:DNA (cytosine-5)-methyltransferase 1